HLTHGSKASVIGQYFNCIGYGLNAAGYIDYEQVYALAQQHKPKLLICGASAYPRTIDFRRFREIADNVGAYLMADISHIAGLVVAGEHPSPIDHCHFTTTSTYKQLYGPRGGLILIGKDHESRMLGTDGDRTLAQLMQRAVFPYFQGTPNLSAIAAKARALAKVVEPGFKKLARQIVANAKTLSGSLARINYKVLTGGTDNHLMLIDVLATKGVTGIIAERALESCNIIINKNRIAGDTKNVFITSGMRLGTNSLALRGMGEEDMPKCADLIDRVLSAVKVRGDREYELDSGTRDGFREEVRKLCRAYPIPRY
ncbi:MAG: serine hydroxymethyltransferase, partial [bacterium]